MKNPTIFPIYRNYIFNLINPTVINGLVVLSGPIANFITNDEMETFLGRFKPLPIICVGLSVEPYASIRVDNFQGMYDLTEHLISAHNCKRIGFISGNTGKNIEAKQRFQGYKKALLDYNITFRSEYIFAGDFSEGTGKTAARYFMDNPRFKLHAVIASNDLMAYDALDEFQTHDLKIPEDLILSGFDNIAKRQLSYPSLTTVAQPLSDMGYYGLEKMVQHIKHNNNLSSCTLKADLIIRRSCGCQSGASSYDISFNRSKVTQKLKKKSQSIDALLKPALKTEIGLHFSHIKKSIVNEWAEKITSGIVQAIKKNTHHYFFEIEKILLETYNYKQSVFLWYNVFKSVFYLLQNCSLQHTHNMIEHLKDYTYSLISEIYYSILNRTNQRIYEQLRQIDLFSRIIITSFSLPEFKRRLKQNITAIGLKCCYIIRFKDLNLKSAELFTYFSPNKKIKITNKSFNPELLLPDGIYKSLDKFNIIVLPLNFEHEKIGFVLFGYAKDFEESLYEIIANQLSTAFKTVQLMQKEKTYSQDLEAEVIKRTADLQNSLKEKNVLIMEIHHRVKNNLQIISSLLHLQSNYSRQNTVVDVLSAARNRIKSMAIIYEKLYRSKDLAHINMKKYIEVLVNTLLTTFNKHRQVTLHLDMDDIQFGVDKAIPCGLIINELVTNAIKHAFDYQAKGSPPPHEICIAISVENRQCQIIMSDNGKGLPKEYSIHNSKTLGLELVSLLTEGQLNGEITLKRKKGTTFTIRFDL